MKRVTTEGVDMRKLDPFFDWDAYWNDIKNNVDTRTITKKMGKRTSKGGYLISPCMYAM